MSKKSTEYRLDISCTGKGHYDAGHHVGFVVVKTKSTDSDEIKDKAWKQLDGEGQGMLPSKYHYLFTLSEPFELNR